ncbi:MAG: OmpA family protein [Bacteroidales bacterium]|nr:OmpA family protein [Bacteroidales bacterium]
MKKINYVLSFSTLILCVLLTSCGPSKKLVASRAWVNQLQTDSANTHNQLNDCKMLVKNLTDEKTTLLTENASVTNDLNALSSSSKMTIAEQANRLKTLQNMLQAQRDVMSNLKNSISDALMKYKTDELSVYIKDGSVYVSLQEKLLFKSGSDVVNPTGVSALKSLALVLNNTKDINVMIEGHTDNVPIKTKLFKDNWDLSTARATSIVRILTKDNGFDSSRITASGKGEFHPLKANDTVEGRAGNRRTEVILSPDLNELYKLLNQ